VLDADEPAENFLAVTLGIDSSLSFVYIMILICLAMLDKFFYSLLYCDGSTVDDKLQISLSANILCNPLSCD
jgi:hypothetical protein